MTTDPGPRVQTWKLILAFPPKFESKILIYDEVDNVD